MGERTLNRRYLSIKWQAFLLTSIVLTTIFAAFLVFVSDSTLKQFEIGRSHVYNQNKQQLDNLIEVAAGNLIQLAGAAPLFKQVTDSLVAGQNEKLSRDVDDIAWNLQIDAGIQDLSVFDKYGELLALAGGAADDALVEAILASESPQWNVRCVAKCYIEAGAPVLVRGDVAGAIVLSEPLSNVMLRFQHIANIDTGLLSEPAQEARSSNYIPAWGKTLIALTNPQNSQEIIEFASARYSLEDLGEGVQLVDVQGEVYELRALPLQDNQVIVISNVSRDIGNMERSRSDSIRISIASLVVAECFLLLLLWRPMSRLRKTAKTLPLLAERRFYDARKTLEDINTQHLFNDESDLLNQTALKLSAELESLQAQLDARARQLQRQEKELEQEREFVGQLLDTVHAIIIIQDESGHIQLANSFATKLSGYSARELKGRSFVQLLERSELVDALQKRLRDVVDGFLGEYQHEAILRTADGGRLHLAWRHAVLYNDETEQRQVLSVAVDVSARVKAESEIAWLASHDTRTGLYNTNRLYEELGSCFALADKGAFRFGLILFEVDADNGDRDFWNTLLAERLKQSSTNTDFPAKVSDTKFGLIVRHFDSENIEFYKDKITKEINTAFTSVRQSTQCDLPTIRVAHALPGSGISDPNALIERASKGLDAV